MSHTGKLFVIGGSAGALQVILKAVSEIRTDISFPILIVLHRKTDPSSVLLNVLSSKTSLPVKEADDKEQLKNGVIYVAPADYHTLLENDGSFSLDYSEKVHYTRPSIDVTLQTAADAYNENLYAVILSGANQDGTDGVMYALRNNAKIWIQDPSTAEVPVMPVSALSASKQKTFKPEELSAIINSVQSS